MAAASGTHTVFHEDPTLRLLFSGNLMMAAWWDAPTVAQMKTVRRASQVLHTRHSKGTGFVSAVLGGTPSFSDEVRREAAELTRESSSYNVGTAHIVLVGGLRGVTVRTFISGVILVGKSTQPVKVFATPDEADMWITPLLSATGDCPWSVGQVRALCDLAYARRPERTTP